MEWGSHWARKGGRAGMVGQQKGREDGEMNSPLRGQMGRAGGASPYRGDPRNPRSAQSSKSGRVRAGDRKIVTPCREAEGRRARSSEGTRAARRPPASNTAPPTILSQPPYQTRPP